MENLTENEYEALLKFPAYISLLAGSSDNKLDEAVKKSAIEFSHIKTYTCDPLLTEFYAAADMVFEKNILELDKELPPDKDKRYAAIKKELANLEKIVLKLGSDYSVAMHNSMQSFKKHVSKAHHNVLVDFIFPVPIKGLSN